MNYNGLVDTIKLRGPVRLTKGGGALFSRITLNRDYKLGKIKNALPTDYTEYRHGYNEVPEISAVQQYNGNFHIHTHKNFIAEYGYGIFMSVPGTLYYMSSLPNRTAKQDKMLTGTKIYLDINIPSVSGLFLMPRMEDYLASKYDGGASISDMLWGYITHIHDWERYGIRRYDFDQALEKNDLGLAQVDIAQNINGRLVKDVMELVSATGYYARKDLRLWNNTDGEGSSHLTTYQGPNGIEFRKGKKSTEIYKFYDKDLQIGQSYKDSHSPIYTPNDARRIAAKRVVEGMEKKERKVLRYEVSLRRVTSRSNAIDRKYSKSAEPKKILLTDVLDNTIYSRTPNSILRDGLLAIFGGEVEKEMTNIIVGENEMTDTDVLKKYKMKGLKYLGVKYLIDQGTSNDKLWRYLNKDCQINYEVVRRLRNDMKDEGVIGKMKDNHIATMDTLKRVYRELG